MRNSYRSFLPLLCCILQAQPAASQAKAPEIADIVKSRAEAATVDPSLTSDVTSGKPQVTLLSDSNNTIASGEIGVNWSDVTRLILRMEAPLQKGAEETSFADLDGLRGGTTASFGLTRYFLRVGNIDNIQGVCVDYNRHVRRTVVPIDILAGDCKLETLEDRDENLASAARQGIGSALAAVCAEYNGMGLKRLRSCSLEELHTAGDPWGKKADEATKKALDAACKSYNAVADEISIDAGDCDYETLVAKGGSWGDAAIAAVGLKPTIIFSLKGSVQNSRFTFAEPPALKRETISRNSAALRVGLGALMRPRVFGGASYRMQHQYEGANATQLCTPLPDTTSFTCSNIALKRPTSDNHHLLQGELRLFPADWLGLNPKYTHDFTSGVNGYQLLAYFLTSKAAGLNGGIDLGFRDDTNKMGLRVFIGATFGVVP
jgi:hypothetical protein